MSAIEPSRSEHLSWSKNRALEILDKGDVSEAFMSFCSDMQKHDETASHPFLGVGVNLMMGGNLKSVTDMRVYIEGFQ